MGFDERADTWDESDRRQALAEAIARAIMEKVALKRSMHLLDVGAGTGLLSRRLEPHVEKITAVDTSFGMLQKLSEAAPGINTIHADILDYRTEKKFDGIVSSMTLHHIEDTVALMRHLYSMLDDGGFITLADLAPEDGDFHEGGNEGVHHFGFDETVLKKMAERAGFERVTYDIVYTIEKDRGRCYDIFLMTAMK